MSRYEELRDAHRWVLPSALNLAERALWAHPDDAPAILVSDGEAIVERVTFGRLRSDVGRLVNALRGLGVETGDRVAIVLSQRPETAVAHLAVAQAGAIAMPLSTGFGPDALAMRVDDARPRVALAEGDAVERLRALGDDELRVVDVDAELPRLLADSSTRFEPAVTTPDTPALLVYTSGTTGAPKGAVHGHRVLAGHLPGFELSHEGFPQPGDVIWTPSDWAWIGGLYDVLVPALHHGTPVVAYRTPRFDPERALRMMAAVGVRNVFMPATALRLLQAAGGPRVALRTVASGGESVGAETGLWCAERFGARFNEFYGQTEANLVIGCCSAWPAPPGAMGRAYPGHEVELIDGEIAVRVEGDPVVFLGYWNRPEATAEKVVDGWLRTGDLATVDDDGTFTFLGRVDDVISSAGYRIGPGEIESCLVQHPAVTLAAVIGVPDPVRGQAIKAFVVPSGGVASSPELVEELRAHVRARLAPFETPREIAFVESLPTTVTGKIRRGELRRLAAGDSEPEPRA